MLETKLGTRFAMLRLCLYLFPRSKPLSHIGVGIGCLHAFSPGRAECGLWVGAGKKERREVRLKNLKAKHSAISKLAG